MMLLFSYIILLLFLKWNKDFFIGIKSTVLRRISLLVIFLAMLLFHYIYFTSNVSIDLNRYEWNFIYRYSNPELSSNYEKGFIFLSNLLGVFYKGTNGYIYILIFSAFILMGYFFFSNLVEKNLGISIFSNIFMIVSSLLFLQNQYLLKQGISMTLFQVGLFYLMFGGVKNRIYIFIFFSSFLFHRASVVPILITVFFIISQKVNFKIRNMYIVTRPVIMFSLFIILYLLSFFIGNGFYLMTAFRGLPYFYLLIISIRSKIFEKNNYSFYSFTLLAICTMYVFSSFNSLFLRINLYFIPFALVYVQLLYLNLDISKKKATIFSFLLIVPSLYELFIRIGGL